MKYAVHTWHYDGSGGYPYWGDDEAEAKRRAAALVGDLKREGWQVSRRFLNGTKTWLYKRFDGVLHRIRVEVEAYPAPEPEGT